MKSKTAERILSETPQETKDKVRDIANELAGLNTQKFEIILDKDYVLGFDPYEENFESKLFKLHKDGTVEYIK